MGFLSSLSSVGVLGGFCSQKYLICFLSAVGVRFGNFSVGFGVFTIKFAISGMKLGSVDVSLISIKVQPEICARDFFRFTI